MKKSSILSLLTSAAIVATSAGTYAVWDTMGADATGEITVPNKTVNVTASLSEMDVNDTLGTDQVTFTGDATFTITGSNSLSAINLTPSLYLDDGITEVEASKATVEVANPTPSEFKEGQNDYAVTVTVKDKELASKKLKVKVSALATAK